MGSESELLKKFRMIMNISQEVSQSQVAKHLELSEGDLFGYLIEWSDSIPFKIRGDMIVIEDINDFMKKLDSQYNTWSDKVLISFEPIENEPMTSFEELFGAVTSLPVVREKPPQIKSTTINAVPIADNETSIDITQPASLTLDELMDFDLEEKEGNTIEIEGQGLTAFPKDLFTKFVDVEELYLAENKIKAIPGKIANLKKLRILDLVENNIMTIPKALTKVRKLSELHLNTNKITTIPDEISALNDLKHLYLDHNQISHLPASLLKMKKLKEFHIEYNYLSESDENDQRILAELKKQGCWVKMGVQLIKDEGQSASLTSASILKIIPKDDWTSIKDLIKRARIIDMERAQDLQEILSEMVNINQLDFTIRNGRKFWKKI
ncbi:MAG: leucine-rich repeat domain-containing protein [Promethearchaeota archaeon]